LKNGPDYDSFVNLGNCYWKNFYRRNAETISAKKAVRVDSKRDDWCLLDNFEDVYDGIYERLWGAGVAEKLDITTWLRDMQRHMGKRHSTRSYIQNLVMVDELVENISQKGDGNFGGQKFVVVNDIWE
jgi:hypothetical protein